MAPLPSTDRSPAFRGRLRRRAMRQRHRPLVEDGIARHGDRRDVVATRPRILERDFHGLRDDPVHAATVPKAHLVLRRMRIRIDTCRVHRQIQHIGRIAAMKQHVPVGMADGMRQRLVRDAAAVHEPVLQIRLTAVERWQTRSSPTERCPPPRARYRHTARRTRRRRFSRCAVAARLRLWPRRVAAPCADCASA